MSNKLYGVDISHHQPAFFLDDKIVDFAIVKATEGTTYKDDLFDMHIQNAIDKGIGLGAYHFARPDTYSNDENDAKNEADNFVNAVNPYIERGLPIVLALDWEMESWNYSLNWARTWLDRVYERTGIKPIMYCNYKRVKDCKIIAEGGYGLWLVRWGVNDGNYRDYGTDISPWSVKSFHQYTSKPYDKNVFFGTREQFDKYGTPDGAEEVEKPDKPEITYPKPKQSIVEALNSIDGKMDVLISNLFNFD